MAREKSQQYTCHERATTVTFPGMLMRKNEADAHCSFAACLLDPVGPRTALPAKQVQPAGTTSVPSARLFALALQPGVVESVVAVAPFAAQRVVAFAPRIA